MIFFVVGFVTSAVGFVAGFVCAMAVAQARGLNARPWIRPEPGVNPLDVVRGICSCGNRFDGDNYCMPSACEKEV